MINYKRIFAIIAVILTLGLAYKFYKKAKGVEKLKLSSVSLKSEKKITELNDLIDILQNGLILKGFVQIKNFSGEDYTLSQMSIDGFSPVSNKIIAEQININQHDIILKDKQETHIPLQYKVDVLSALLLFKESGVIPEGTTLWEVITHPAKYYESTNLNKLKIVLKGFIEAEGITININQTQYLFNE